MTEKLRACPFCGGTAIQRTEHDADMVRWGYVGCSCGVRTRGKFGDLDPITWAEIRDEWNRRASPDMEQRAGFVMVPVAQVVHEKFKDSLGGQHERRKVVLFKEGLDLPDGTLLAAAHPIEALEGGKTDLGASGALGASGDGGSR